MIRCVFWKCELRQVEQKIFIEMYRLCVIQGWLWCQLVCILRLRLLTALTSSSLLTRYDQVAYEVLRSVTTLTSTGISSWVVFISRNVVLVLKSQSACALPVHSCAGHDFKW